MFSSRSVCESVCARGPVHTAGVWAQWLIAANDISSVSLKYCQMLHSEKECVCVSRLCSWATDRQRCAVTLCLKMCVFRDVGAALIFFSILSHTHTWLYRSLWQRQIYMSTIQQCVMWFTLRSHFGQYLNLFSLAEQNLTFPSYMLLAALRSLTSKDYTFMH